MALSPGPWLKHLFLGLQWERPKGHHRPLYKSGLTSATVLAPQSKGLILSGPFSNVSILAAIKHGLQTSSSGAREPARNADPKAPV